MQQTVAGAKQLDPQRPLRIISVAFGVIYIAFFILIVVHWQTSRSVTTAIKQDSALMVLAERILYFDEVLTMSTHMAVVTSEKKWITRYHRIASQLDEAIKKAKAASSNTVILEGVELTQQANDKLVALEKKTFAHIRNGKQQQAMTLLNSPEYLRQKQRYKQGIYLITDHLRQRVQKIVYDYRNAEIYTFIATALAFVLMAFTWLVARNIVRSYIWESNYWQSSLQEVNRNLEKKVEERTLSLHNLSKQLHLFIQYAPAAIAMFDRDMRYVAASRRWIEDYQLQNEKIIGKSHYEIFPEIPESWRKIHAHCLEGNTAANPEDCFVREGGQTEWVRWEIHPWYDQSHNKVEGIIMFTEVITQQRKYQAALQELNQKLEQRVKERTQELEAKNQTLRENQQKLQQAREEAETANKAKSSFLSNMSHELRTPLNAIKGFTELCMKTSLTEEQQDYLSKIHLSSQSLLRIIGDILDFSKIEASKMVLEETEFDLQDVLDDLAVLFVDEAIKKNIEFLTIREPDVPSALIGDAFRLRQVLMNLISNALKFTDEGEISLQVVCKNQSGEQATIVFMVSDTGVGISQENIGKLFSPFTQADESITRMYGGTGLGLAICIELVELMGGKLQVESELGKGSRFFFSLSFKKQLQQENLYSKVKKIGSLKILVLEENATYRSYLLETLRRFGFDVSGSQSEREAIEKMHQAQYQGSPYQLLLLGLNLCFTEEILLVKEMNQNPEVASPIIVISNLVRQEDISLRVNPYFKGFLRRPLRLSQLLDTIMDVASETIKGSLLKEESELEKEVVAKLQGKKVLVVEDNEINQTLMEHLLGKLQLQVTIVKNGKQAIEILSKENFDLVFMDIQMPEMDGYQTSQYIRRELGLKDLVIVALTAHASTKDKYRCLMEGMNDHVGKPIESQELCQTLVKWIPPLEDWQSRKAKAMASNNKTKESQPDLPNIPNVDISSGLMRVRGNTKLYKKLLTRFLENYSDAIKRIKKALSQNDKDTALNLIHTIKGVAGNLGAKELNRVASTLEKSLRGSDEEQVWSFSLELFEKSLSRVLNSIENLSSSSSSTNENIPKKTLLSKEQLTEKLKQLRPHLSSGMPNKCKPALKELQEHHWPEKCQESLQQLIQYTGRYNFKKALQQLDTILEQLRV